jgi:hypothetical protein
MVSVSCPCAPSLRLINSHMMLWTLHTVQAPPQIPEGEPFEFELPQEVSWTLHTAVRHSAAAYRQKRSKYFTSIISTFHTVSRVLLCCGAVRSGPCQTRVLDLPDLPSVQVLRDRPPVYETVKRNVWTAGAQRPKRLPRDRIPVCCCDAPPPPLPPADGAAAAPLPQVPWIPGGHRVCHNQHDAGTCSTSHEGQCFRTRMLSDV